MSKPKIYLPIKFDAPNNYSFSVSDLSSFFEFVDDPEHAHCLFFPVFYEVLYEYSDKELDERGITDQDKAKYISALNYLTEQALKTDKYVLLFYYRDPVHAITVDRAIIFRTSLCASSKKANEYSLPAFVEDIKYKTTEYGFQEILAKPTKPTIGFCGQSAPLSLPLKSALRLGINNLMTQINLPHRINTNYNFGYLARRAAIIACNKSKLVETDFAVNPISSVDYKSNFYKNIYSNAYTLCVSGHGNYSYRLYETLCAGRIPLFINTDNVLPFQDNINWASHIVCVDEKNIKDLPTIVYDFHNSLNEDEFVKIQKANRELWISKLSKIGFLNQLSDTISDYINK